ncbi:MAG: hypothetical protein A49_28940 [Methyloceanibacter sp.]|nr:MAG: hypothetical protein A49_28940 [Methyloceanibacter sp.]
MARRARAPLCALLLSVLALALLLPEERSFAAPEGESAKAAKETSAKETSAKETSAKAPPAKDTASVNETGAAPENGAADEDSAPVYVWSASRNQSRIILRGAVPSEEDRQTALGMVKAHFPDLKVEERVKVVDAGFPREQWLAAVSFSLQQLANMKRGKVRLSDAKLAVGGQAANAEDYAQIKKALAGQLPAGLTLTNDDVRPPVADPFVFTADLGPNSLSLAGSVPSENARKHVRDLSRQLFARPGLDDRLQVASGAPKNWDEAVSAALRALSRLESGKVALSGIAVSIEGVAPDQGTAVAVSYQLRRDLPKMFSTSESIKWKKAMGPHETLLKELAKNVIPRIKTTAEDSDKWRGNALPQPIPLANEQ